MGAESGGQPNLFSEWGYIEGFKAMVPTEALLSKAIKRFCSLARKILFNQDQMEKTPGY